MRYLLLIYMEEHALNESERQHCYAESTELAHQLKANGQLLATAPLKPTSTATSVRVRDGKRSVTDGPFAETREQLGGYFLVEAQDNFEINGSQPIAAIAGQVMDTIQIPFWDGNPDHPFPSVTVRMDFRGPDIGDFIYHCHIAEHEDDGMVAIIRVTKSSAAARIERTRLYLAMLGESMGLIAGPDLAEAERAQAWCIRRRTVYRRASASGPEIHADNR